jgi:AcrR family transcriptional regulator
MNADSPSRSGAGRNSAPAAAAVSAPGAATPAARGRLREQFRAATRDAILTAAEQALARHGARGAKMEIIAVTAGIAVGTLYNYFADRQELIDALFEVRRAELVAALDAALEQGAPQPFERRLEAFLGAGLAHFQAHREFIALVMADELTSGHGSRWNAQRELRARAERLIEQGIESGLLRPEDRATYPHVVIGLLKGLIDTAVAVSDVLDMPPRALEAAVRCFMHGARKSP